MRFADPPVVASQLKVLKCRHFSARSTVELRLNQVNISQDEEHGARIRTCTRHTVAKLAQAGIALVEQVFGLTIFTLPVRQKACNG